jgi:hypothetical protein
MMSTNRAFLTPGESLIESLLLLTELLLSLLENFSLTSHLLVSGGISD